MKAPHIAGYAILASLALAIVALIWADKGPLAAAALVGLSAFLTGVIFFAVELINRKP